MKKLKYLLIGALLLLVACHAEGQTKPKKRIHRDTIKTVQERIEYLPDTIPVYFKEVSKIAIKCMNCGDTIVEQWHKGFVVWQTYRTFSMRADSMWSMGTNTFSNPVITAQTIEYFKDEYQFTQSMPGIFLYEDKTKCKNLVIYSIKR